VSRVARLAFAALFLTGGGCDKSVDALWTGAPPDGGAGGHPAALPSRMLIGIEDNDGSWVGASGVRWDVRWAYFTGSGGKGWYNNFGYGNNGTGLETPAGSFALGWLQGVDQQGFIPAIQYALVQTDYGGVGAGGQGLLTLVRDAASMKDYFTKVKLLLTDIALFGKPVIVIVEGNALGYLEEQTGNDPTAAAAVASTGLPELAGLGDTVADFGLAFLALRQATGATNAILGPDVPEYAAMGDILYQTFDDLAPHVDYQASFFSALGLSANPTGARFDFAASNPGSWDEQDPSSPSYGVVWDPSDSAPVTGEASFNRYAEYLQLFHAATGAPWLLWQVPMGNSNSPNVPNAGGAWAGPYAAGYALPAGCAQGSTTGCPGGYQDNRPEYFFGTTTPPNATSDAHLGEFAAAGVFGLLFGAGQSEGSDQTDDYYTDGQLFMKSHAGALVNGGGFALP
jgi:hypothetical protein